MEEQKTSTETKNRSSNLFMILMIIFILIGAGLAVWLIVSKSNLKQLQDEKEKMKIALQTELDSLLAEHNRIREENAGLADTLYLKDSVIQSNAKEIKNLLNYKWDYFKIKKKFEKLQVIAQGYVRQMDSIKIVNAELVEENIMITKKYQSEVAKTNVLAGEKQQLNNQVAKAAVLQTYNLKAEGLQLKWGGDKEKETDKAKRVGKIKVCFTLSENPILPHGNKAIFVRIARPDKLILTPSRGDEYSFNYHGEKLQYSIMNEINYQGVAMDLCLDWEKRSEKEEMMIGTYHIEVFSDDNVIGHTTITLR